MTALACIRSYENAMPGIFVRFYAVGLVLFSVPFTRGLFVSITALSLLLAIATVLLFHRTWNRRTILWFAFIVVSSFLLEMAGVRSGRIFGVYAYGPGLAPLLNGTPLIIGFNWLLLVYASHDLAARAAKTNPLQRILVGSLLMILYDGVLEWVAPFMRMWHFESGFAPFRNFAVWFAAALVYHSGFELLGIRSNNRPARVLFGLQIVFFLLIGLYAQLFMA